MPEILKILEETQPRNKNAAIKKIRARLVRIIFEESPSLEPRVMEQLLPEIILYTKEINAKTRDAAESTLLYLVRSYFAFLMTLYNVMTGRALCFRRRRQLQD